MQSAAALVWIAQAALLALAVQQLADGKGFESVIGPALGYVAWGAVRSVADAWAARRLFDAARRQLTLARTGAAASLARRSPLDRERPASGLAASTVAEQADALVPWLSRYEPARWRMMVVPPLIALAVATQSWIAALILVLSAPLIPIFMALIGWRAKAASEEQLQALGGMNGFLLDRLRGLATLRALGAVDATAGRLRASAEALRGRTMRVLRIAFLSSASLELFSALGVALVAVYVGFHLLGQLGVVGTWGSPLSLGEGLFVLLLAPAFYEPLRELSAVWHDRAAGQAASEALETLQAGGLPLPGAMNAQGPQGPTVRVGAAPSVAIEDLAFAHANEGPLFTGLDLLVRPGERVALVGASGAGKSTLLALIAGLAPAGAGGICIGGVPLHEGNAEALRTHMAWIGQTPHVFHGTVAGNISLHRPGVSRARVAAAVARASLTSVDQARPDGGLGEGGAGLSGGERVRLALARAMAAPDATLVLADEPTAHLDRETADEVADALLQLAQGRTLIVSTHDPALVARLDRVIRLDGPRREARVGLNVA